MRKKIVIILIIIIVLAGAGVYWRFMQSRSSLPAYQTVKVTRGNIRLTVSAPGPFESRIQMVVRADTSLIPDRLEKISVGVGQEIKVGETIALVNDTRARLQWEQSKAGVTAAKANLDHLEKGPAPEEVNQARRGVEKAQIALDDAQKVWERKNQLYSQGLISQQEWETARFQYDQAKINYEISRLQLDSILKGTSQEEIEAARASLKQARIKADLDELAWKSTRIVSPIAGKVLMVMVREGDIINPQTPIAVVADTRQMLLKAEVDEIDIGKIKIGQPAEIRLDVLPERVMIGQVTAIDFLPKAGKEITVYEVTIAVDNEEGLILAGMNADGEIVVEEVNNVLTVPRSAIRRLPEGSFVEVVEGGKQILRKIEVGLSDEIKTEVKKGLTAGEEVVVSSGILSSQTPGGRGISFPMMQPGRPR